MTKIKTVNITPTAKHPPYRLHIPEHEQNEKLPLLLLMHGMGSVGTDNLAHISAKGTANSARNIMKYADYRNGRFILLAPQTPYPWVDTDWTKTEHHIKTEPTPTLKLTLDLLEMLAEQLNADKKRIYVTGASMGGFASWELCARASHIFAAALVVCGGGDPASAKTIADAKIPVWFTHGDADNAVPCENSAILHNALLQHNAETVRSIYPGYEHNVWEATYSNPAYLDWLFAHTK